MTALVTAVYGGYDDVAPAPGDFTEHVLVTDDKHLRVPGWQTRYAPSGFPPRLAAKRPKCVPWTVCESERSVWVDASIEVRPGLRAVVDRLLDEHEVVAVRHPAVDARPTIAEEAAHSQPLPKYEYYPLLLQAREYLAGGCPGRLFACGVVARRHGDRVRQAGYAWLRECHDWSPQDQVSFHWAHWRYAVEPYAWDIPLLDNEWWTRRPHRDGS